MVLEGLTTALDELAGADPAVLADGESIVALHRGLARLEAVTTRASAAFEASRDWQADGARSAAGWLAVRAHVPKAAAQRRLRLGRALRHLPAAEQSWLSGDIGAAQVSALAGARSPATEEAMERDEEMLVAQATKPRYGDVAAERCQVDHVGGVVVTRRRAPPPRRAQLGSSRYRPVIVSASRPRRLTASRREEERVTPLELFFDLVFVLALTRTTAFMVDDPSWEGIGRALLVLAMLWWAWVGYAWLTSVIDPEEGGVRLALFVAMGGFLVAALCATEAFGDAGLAFAVAYGVVRAAHIGLFVLTSWDDEGLRRSVVSLGLTTAIGVGLLASASFTGGSTQVGLWMLALVIDVGGSLVADPGGWRLDPGHFAERHGLIIIIALGESIVALGASAEEITGGVIAASVAGMVLAAGLWWLYFDVIAYSATRVLVEVSDVEARNRLARDAYSHLHFPMVAGIVLVAFGLHEALAHVDEPLALEPSAALFGGAALYLLGHVAFNRRNTGAIKVHRLLGAGILVLLVPVATLVDALGAVGLTTAVICCVIVYENVRYAEARKQIRQAVLLHGHGDGTGPAGVADGAPS